MSEADKGDAIFNYEFGGSPLAYSWVYWRLFQGRRVVIVPSEYAGPDWVFQAPSSGMVPWHAVYGALQARRVVFLLPPERNVWATADGNQAPEAVGPPLWRGGISFVDAAANKPDEAT